MPPALRILKCPFFAIVQLFHDHCTTALRGEGRVGRCNIFKPYNRECIRPFQTQCRRCNTTSPNSSQVSPLRHSRLSTCPGITITVPRRVGFDGPTVRSRAPADGVPFDRPFVMPRSAWRSVARNGTKPASPRRPVFVAVRTGTHASTAAE